jgi:hypothetical protein
MRYFTGLLLLLFLLNSCTTKEVKVPVPDVSSINIDFNIDRYESQLKEIDTSNIEKSFSLLQKELPGFTDLYFQSIVPLNRDQYDELFYADLTSLLKDKRFRFLIDTVQQLYPRFEETVGMDLEIAFKTYKYYFPKFEAPEVYTLVSEYAYQMFLFEVEPGVEGLGIGLDMFLGSSFPYHKIAPGVPTFSEYLTRSFSREYIVRKAITTLLDDRWPPERNRTLLDFMISNGKKLYVLNHILPETPDSILIEYTGEQLKWVKDNELSIWSFLFGEELFYETNMMKINKYINPSPNSPGMPPAAPGRTGNYIGWQIIKSYMELYPETTLGELIGLPDAQKIMELAKYRPKQKK